MKKQFYFLPIFFISITLTMVTLGSCSREKSFETDEGKVTVKKEGKKMKIKTKEGIITMTGEGEEGQVDIKAEGREKFTVSYKKGKLADSFPKDVPIYSPSKVAVSQVMGDGKSVLAKLTTPDDPSMVANFYKKRLPKEGWEIKNEMDMHKACFFSKGQKEKEH